MTDQQPTPLWEVMRDALISETGTTSVDSTDRVFIELPLDGDCIAAEIEALTNWLVPEEPPPDVPPSWGKTWDMYEQRLRIRYRLLGEARQAREAVQ